MGFAIQSPIRPLARGVLTPGGLTLTLSLIFGLARNMILSVALGYHRVYLCLAPQLLTAVLLGIGKSIADKEFRRDQVIYALIGSLVPCITQRWSTDAMLDDAEGSKDATGEVEEAEDFNEMTEEESEEANEVIVTRRSTSKELCALFLSQTLSVIIGAASFAFLHETSTDFAASMTKVEAASGINPALAVYIGSPVALLASVSFRAIHTKLGPWQAMQATQPSDCGSFCPPSLNSREEQVRLTLVDAVQEELEQSVSNPQEEIEMEEMVEEESAAPVVERDSTDHPAVEQSEIFADIRERKAGKRMQEKEEA